MAIRSHQPTEKELKKRLKSTVLAIIAIIAILILSFTNFGPKIGSFFGLISVHRGDTGPGDTIAPAAPAFSSVPNATDKKTLTLKGFAEPGTTIKLYLNGPEKDSVIVDARGSFTFSNIQLMTGRNTLYAKAIDSESNESEKSTTLTVTVDTKEPKITIKAPNPGDVVKNLDNRITITGSVNEHATVKVNGKTTVVKPDLSFEVLIPASEGEMEIKIIATDEAGNAGDQTFKVTYVKSAS